MTATVGRESIWVISRATEMFIGRMMQGGYNNAVLDKHSTVSINDLGVYIAYNVG